MKTYLNYKNQLRGFEDVSATVKVMEKIAASSVHFLKNEVANLNKYQQELEKALRSLSFFYSPRAHPLLQKNKAKAKALMVMSADKGLVGGLWHQLVNLVLVRKADYSSIIVIGRKGENYLKEEKVVLTKAFNGFVDIPELKQVDLLAGYVFDKFKKGKFARVDIVYPRFVSLAKQEPSFISFLPFELTALTKTVNNQAKSFSSSQSGSKRFFSQSLGLPLFEPSRQGLFSVLIGKYIKIYLHRIVLETKLSELSARTVAMEHASAKTNQMIQKLTALFRKERRRIVTQRQLRSFSSHLLTYE